MNWVVQAQTEVQRPLVTRNKYRQYVELEFTTFSVRRRLYTFCLSQEVSREMMVQCEGDLREASTRPGNPPVTGRHVTRYTN